MHSAKIAVLAVSLLAMAGNAGAFDLSSICCDGGYEYRHPSSWEIEQQRLRDALAAAQKENGVLSSRTGDLERQLADRNRELASAQSSATDLQRQLADRDQQLAALRTSSADASQLASQLSVANSEKDVLAASLAASQAQVVALKAGSGDKDKLAAALAAAHQRNRELELQLAAAGSQASSVQAGMSDKDKLAAELVASNDRTVKLEKQLADRDKELAALRGELSAEMAKLTVAQRGLIRALRPEIEQGNITVDLNNERLRINLASSMLFGSGEDQLKPAGVDALKRVGAVLKDYPEYKVIVDGHTDNRPIRSTLKKRFPTNKELSTARAANGVTALEAGGISADYITSAGYADTKPVAPNTTNEGRQKNRRVEVSVTPKS
ncbi:MAG TPA: OmpA family protein [Nitrospira sp.]|nr:OmpA family protein [Nitrospira sp.]